MGKVIMLTSGTSGIGRAIANKILKETTAEDKLIINYGHNDAMANEMYNELSETDKNRVVFIKADMSSYEGMEGFIEKVKSETEYIDWIVLNTGIGTYKKFDEYTYEIWENVIRTNLSVPVFLIKNLKSMIRQGGAIVLMGSHAGQEPYSSSLVYSISKAGVLFMAKSLVKFLEAGDVRINAIAPGFIETRWQEDRTDESRERINKKIAKHRFGAPEEVADLCYHILQNDYLNGSIFDIHGGYNYF